ETRRWLARNTRRYARARGFAFRSGTRAVGRVARACVGDESGQMRALFVVVLAGALLFAETPFSVLNLTATTANVVGAPDPVRIEILRWSTDEERTRLASAWDLKTVTSVGPGAGKATGKGAAKQGKGG